MRALVGDTRRHHSLFSSTCNVRLRVQLRVERAVLAAIVLHTRVGCSRLQLLVDHVDGLLADLSIFLAFLDLKPIFGVTASDHSSFLIVFSGTQRLSRLISQLLALQLYFSLFVLHFFDFANELGLDLCFPLLLELEHVLSFLGSFRIRLLYIIHDSFIV